MVEKFDVIICGAGPAGTTCALALGSSGLKVALVDKSNFPRDKICGDAIAAYVPKVLSTINPNYVKALADFTEKEKVNTIRIVSPNTKALDISYGVDGFISTRVHFDNFLLNLVKQLANVKLFLNTAILDVVANEKEAYVILANDIKLEAALIIGCDGEQGITRKKFTQTQLDPKHHAAAVRAYFKNVKGIPESTFELHFIDNVVPGYFWIFPLPNNEANVGLGIVSKSVAAKKLNLRQEMQRIIETNPYIKERFAGAEMISKIEGYGLPLGSRKTTISGDRFMLCGDAASLIDPLTGEGIGQAIISGRYAGWQAKKCFEQNNFSASFMKEYDKTVYDKLWKEHRRNYFIRELIINKPRLFNALTSILNKSKFLYNLTKKMFN
ncbi:MAG TPA: geranylgeranyl reductase family protein [Bacteroidia bacterium]|jgi:geranylgeranyl reductase family protein|nr:geranylgeranyl reductase family protein [Bacteroidia bacterium]